MATTSYLEAVAGGMVAGAAFSDDDAAVQAVTLLSQSGVREQDICVLARNAQRAELVAGGRACAAGKGLGRPRYRLRKVLPGAHPRDVASAMRPRSTRQARRHRRGGGQPPDNDRRALPSGAG